MNISYDEYLRKTNKGDIRESWIDWKVECCGMSYMGALREANDPDCGYEN